jgi:hypothetical protein
MLLGAHYDSFFQSPGANDDASALAVLLDAGERLKFQSPNSPVRIVFFDDEEPTLYWRRPVGSTLYVKEFGLAGLRAMITLELCGMGDAVAIWPVEGLEGRAVLKQMTGVLGEMEIPFEFGRRIPGFYADYLPFREAGFADAYCLTVFPQLETIKLRRFAEGSAGGMLLRYFAWRFLRLPTVPKLFQHYHNKTDRAEFLSEQTLQMMSDVVYRMIISLTSEAFAEG